MKVLNAEIKEGLTLVMDCEMNINYQITADLIENNQELVITDTIFENDEISIETTNDENVYYVTSKPDYEVLGYFKNYN